MSGGRNDPVPRALQSGCRRAMRGATVLIALVLARSPVASAAVVEIERIDGVTLRGSVTGFSPISIAVEIESIPSTVSIDDLREMRFSTSRSPDAPAATGLIVFHLASGGHLRGEIVADADEAVVARTAIGDAVKLPLKSLAGVWLGRPDAAERARRLFDEAMADRLTGKDVLITVADGQPSAVRGSVTALGPSGGRVVLGREERDFSMDRILGIAFATGLAGGGQWPVSMELTDGSAFAARLSGGDARGINVVTEFGFETSIDVGRIRAMRFASTRVVPLSALTPAARASTGVLVEQMPARFDANVVGGLISLDGRTYPRGVGVHADSRIEYDLGGGYEVLCATIGIDDGVRPRGSVTMSVLGDGKPLFESGTLTGRDAARDIRVDVRGVSRMALVVDHGADLDLSDRANWADARLIKPAGATSP